MAIVVSASAGVSFAAGYVPQIGGRPSEFGLVPREQIGVVSGLPEAYRYVYTLYLRDSQTGEPMGSTICVEDTTRQIRPADVIGDVMQLCANVRVNWRSTYGPQREEEGRIEVAEVLVSSIFRRQ